MSGKYGARPHGRVAAPAHGLAHTHAHHDHDKPLSPDTRAPGLLCSADSPMTYQEYSSIHYSPDYQFTCADGLILPDSNNITLERPFQVRRRWGLRFGVLGTSGLGF